MKDSFVLGLDLDGVVGQYIEALRPHVSRITGVAPELLPDPPQWSLSESWNAAITDTPHFLQLHTQAVADGMFREMPLMPGVRDALWTLSDSDVYIRVVTHRLISKGHHQLMAGDTIAWLQANDLPYRDLCFAERKVDVGADVYIDDGPHNIEALHEAGKNVIIFDQSYNQGLEGARAHNWDEATEMILDYQRLWLAERDEAARREAERQARMAAVPVVEIPRAGATLSAGAPAR